MGSKGVMGPIGIFVPDIDRETNERLVVALEGLTHRAPFEMSLLASPSSCGWVAYTRGDWRRARLEARTWLNQVHRYDVITIPSPACVQFVRHYMSILFAGDDVVQELLDHARGRTMDLGRLLHARAYTPPPANTPRRCVLVPSCVSPHLPGIVESARTLLAAVDGLEVHVLPLHRCCSWGGAFHRNLPELSRAMSETIAEAIRSSGADFAVVLDPGCLPLLREVAADLEVYHLAEVMAGRVS